jgi:hypothetical protein
MVLMVSHLSGSLVVFVVIDGRIDEKINNTSGDGGNG